MTKIMLKYIKLVSSKIYTSFSNVSQLYIDDPILSETSVCSVSGLDMASTLQGFFKKMHTLDNFQVHW